jgi:hypothetical protein
MNQCMSSNARPRPATVPRFVPALARATALALVVLAGVAIAARAEDPDGAKRLVPVPSSGVEVELWSDPPAGSLVHPGSRARLYARTNADCYLALISVDTEGRLRLLYPRPFDDGWIAGGRTYRVPEPGSGSDLVFAGPVGMEYVYAVASLSPLRSRYPEWMAQGMEPEPLPDDWADDVDPYRTGWVVGDPFQQVRAFCEELVPYPDERDSYATAWVYFHLGRRVSYPRYLCSDCHWGGGVDPYGPACPAVRVRVGNFPCSGYIDFRLAWFPRYTYEVWTGWRPRHWGGGRWDGPDGRWVWSSADGHRRLRDRFADARSPGRDVRGPRERDDNRGSGPWDRGRGTPGRGDVQDVPRGEGREVSPQRPDEGNSWGRGFDERLRRAVGEREQRRSREDRSARTREPDVRNADPRPGVTPSKPPSRPDRGDRGREPSRSRDSAPRSPDRSPRAEHGRSR